MSTEPNPFSLCGRTILVTGGSSGIGRAVAIGAARMGARIAVLGRTPDKVQETLSLLEGTGHFGHVSDLTEIDGIEGDVQALLDRSGPFAGFVHSAGASDVTLLRDIDMKKAEGQMRLNWLSFMALSQAVCRRGRYAPGLSVVALASISALAGQVGLSAYAGTKGALIASVRSLAAEYAPRGIRFNCISPCRHPHAAGDPSPARRGVVQERGPRENPTGAARPRGRRRPRPVPALRRQPAHYGHEHDCRRRMVALLNS